MDWTLSKAVKDKQNIASDWNFTGLELIDGVRVKEMKNVFSDIGTLTEIYRSDWNLDDLPVDQVFQIRIKPNDISGWHAHEFTLDRLFVNKGIFRIVLYDAREDSPTQGRINEVKVGEHRPALILVPPKVYHAVQNTTTEESWVINLVDRAYQYEDPDHWRIPLNDPSIPYTFKR